MWQIVTKKPNLGKERFSEFWWSVNWQIVTQKPNLCFRNMHLNQARNTRRASSSLSWPTWSRRMDGTETWPGPAQPIVTSTTCAVQQLCRVTVGRWAGTGHQGHHEAQAGVTIYCWTAFWEMLAPWCVDCILGRRLHSIEVGSVREVKAINADVSGLRGETKLNTMTWIVDVDVNCGYWFIEKRKYLCSCNWTQSWSVCFLSFFFFFFSNHGRRRKLETLKL